MKRKVSEHTVLFYTLMFASDSLLIRKRSVLVLKVTYCYFFQGTFGWYRRICTSTEHIQFNEQTPGLRIIFTCVECPHVFNLSTFTPKQLLSHLGPRILTITYAITTYRSDTHTLPLIYHHPQRSSTPSSIVVPHSAISGHRSLIRLAHTQNVCRQTNAPVVVVVKPLSVHFAVVL